VLVIVPSVYGVPVAVVDVVDVVAVLDRHVPATRAVLVTVVLLDDLLRGRRRGC
jgi:hypothetical protein